jgi:hypothetical protein
MGRICSLHRDEEEYIYIGFWWEIQKRPLGRPIWRWRDNIKMNLGEIWWGSMNWIHAAQDMDQWRALVNTVMCLRVA